MANLETKFLFTMTTKVDRQHVCRTRPDQRSVTALTEANIEALSNSVAEITPRRGGTAPARV